MAKKKITSAKAKKDAMTRQRQLRMDAVAPLYNRGYTYRQIRDMVKADLQLKTYALDTVKRDIEGLLKEWRAQRLADTDSNVLAELARISDMEKECWDAWEKSKVKADSEGNPVDSSGDVRFMETLNRLSQERRKLLGLYAAEKKEVTGVLSFEEALIRTGIKDEQE